MAVRDELRQIQMLQKRRGARVVDPSIEAVVRGTRTSMEKRHRRLGAIIEAWEATVPGDLARRSTVTGLRGGIAHVSVDSATTHFELDRALRCGLLEDVRRRYGQTLTRIRLKVSRQDVDGPAEPR